MLVVSQFLLAAGKRRRYATDLAGNLVNRQFDPPPTSVIVGSITSRRDIVSQSRRKVLQLGKVSAERIAFLVEPLQASVGWKHQNLRELGVVPSTSMQGWLRQRVPA